MGSVVDTWVEHSRGFGRRLLHDRGDQRHAWARRLHAWLFLAAILSGAICAMDRLTALPEVRADRSLAVVSGTRPRMFVLIIDSLRWQTAMDPRIMPSLASLRARGSWGRFLPPRDAVTVPSLRAAFTGRERTSLFGFVENLRHRETGLESLFSEARAAGFTSAAYSEGSFLQFGTQNVDLLFNEAPADGGNLEREEAAFPAALADYCARRHDVVIFHATYGDHRAHELGGPGNPLYAGVYRRLDDLVRRADEVVGPDETLLVMGDHGHDERANHLLGVDAPTSAVYRGPGYRQGFDLGTVPNTAHRFLAGFALRLPLPASYLGPRPVQALASAFAPGYAAQVASPPPEHGIPRSRRLDAVILVAWVGVLGLLWVSLMSSRIGFVGALASWAAVTPMAVPALLPWSAAAGMLIGITCIAVIRPWPLRPATYVLVTSAAVAVALAFMLWGTVLADLPMNHPRQRHIVMWGLLVAVTCVLARRWGAAFATWLLLGTTLLVFFPTLYVYGAPSVMGPAWMAWLLAQLVPPKGQRFVVRREQLVLVAITAAMVSQFCVPDATNFVFMRWRMSADEVIPHWWNILALVALLVVLLHPAQSLRGRSLKSRTVALGLAAALLVGALHSGRVSPGRAEIGIAAALACAALLLRSWPDLARLAGVSAGLVAMHALIRVPAESYLWADAFLALLVLSADLAYVTHRDDASSSQAFLLVIGVMAVGWSIFTWSLSRLEWHFLYDWLPAATVEREVGLLVPFILARFALVVWLVRFVLAERFGDKSPPLRVASLLVGAKALTAVLVACGTGWVTVETDVYLSAAQQGAIWLIVLSGLV